MTDNFAAKMQRNNMLASLEKLVAESCHCKLRAKCIDKNSADCLKHRNIYAEEMLKRQIQSKA